MSDAILELQASELEDGSGWQISSPAVGLYAEAPREGSVFRAGEACGCLVVLERVHRLVLPAGVGGFIASAPPERKHLPVGFGSALFVLRRSGDAAWLDADPAGAAAADDAAGLVLRAPQTGRFYRRASPEAPLFAEEGAALESGRTVGLLEVMKTFNPVKYAAGAGLPERATLVRFLVEDGAEVDEGQPLLEVAAS